MVSAPSGRVKKKKKKCTSRSYNDGNSDCHSLHSSAFIENTFSITLSFSLYFLPMHVTSLHSISCPSYAHARRFIACTTNFLRFLFPSFERRCCGASLWQSSWRRVWQSSLTRQCSRHDEKKLHIWCCVINNQTSTYTMNIYDRGHTYALHCFSWRKNWWQSIGIALFIHI